MYTGINSEGINREVVATLECTSLNRRKKKTSLAIPKAAILHIAKSLAADRDLTLTKAEVEANVAKTKGILPAFRHMVDLDSQVSKHQEGVTPFTTPISSEDIESYSLDPFADSYFCKLCHTELFNSFMHCNGCERLLGTDFDLCIQCHQEGTFEDFHQMHPTSADRVSTLNHTGKMASSCKKKKGRKQVNCSECSRCLQCSQCSQCSCQCHTSFTHMRRLYTNDALKDLLKVLEESVVGSDIQYCKETEVRLKLTADREDVEALKAKLNLLDSLRNVSDLAGTGERKAKESADVDPDADVDT
jgi:hypothetical protein